MEATYSTPWNIFWMKSYQDMMISILRKYFMELKETNSHQLVLWAWQVLPQDYVQEGWCWVIDHYHQITFGSFPILPDFIRVDSLIKKGPNLEQDFLSSQLKTSHRSDDIAFVSTSHGQQHLISEGGDINTCKLRVIIYALLQRQENYMNPLPPLVDSEPRQEDPARFLGVIGKVAEVEVC